MVVRRLLYLLSFWDGNFAVARLNFQGVHAMSFRETDFRWCNDDFFKLDQDSLKWLSRILAAEIVPTHLQRKTSKIFDFRPYLRKYSNPTNVLEIGWNH